MSRPRWVSSGPAGVRTGSTVRWHDGGAAGLADPARTRIQWRVDLQTAAARLGVHYQTAYRWVRDGSLPAVKRRGAYEVAERDVERFRSARAAPAPPPRHTHVRSWPHQADRLFD